MPNHPQNPVTDPRRHLQVAIIGAVVTGFFLVWALWSRLADF